MKICVTGKGGSGKSMISALLAKSLAKEGYKVLVVDADESNLGLARMLGVPDNKETFMEHLGGKPAIRERLLSSLTRREGEPKAPILTEEQIRTDDLPPEKLATANGIKLLKIGKIEHSLEGCACPIGALSRDFLTKLVPAEHEVVIADMEAGIEHFGRGVDTAADVILAIVTPSYESVLLAEKIVQLGNDINTRVVVILNNVSPELQRSLESSLKERGISAEASIRNDPVVFESCLKGESLEGVTAQEDVAKIVKVLGL